MNEQHRIIKMKQMENVILLSVFLLASFALHGENRPNALRPSAGDDLSGKVIHSWLANSFFREQGHQWVPVNVWDIGVTRDGTVFSAGVAEYGGGVGSYKDGRIRHQIRLRQRLGQLRVLGRCGRRVCVYRNRGRPVSHAPGR